MFYQGLYFQTLDLTKTKVLLKLSRESFAIRAFKWSIIKRSSGFNFNVFGMTQIKTRIVSVDSKDTSTNDTKKNDIYL